ncbi:MAG: hypothetical protein AAFQ63_07060 [Cyanobacteria bacterium J06621_11]
MPTTSFIVYACPVGPLATQIETYLQQSQQRYGKNSAHAYMPHCTLTGFFRDEVSAVDIYTAALEASLNDYSKHISQPPITIEQVTFNPNWHGLVLNATWLKQLIVSFAKRADSPTRTDALRLKDWLHLSLAYDFKPNQGRHLQQLATQLIDITAPVAWELRVYERREGNQWTCHQQWPLVGQKRSQQY